jgi:hypothetical protein
MTEQKIKGKIDMISRTGLSGVIFSLNGEPHPAEDFYRCGECRHFGSDKRENEEDPREHEQGRDGEVPANRIQARF